MDPHPLTVTTTISFRTHDTWTAIDTTLTGELSDGREVQVVTHNDHTVAPGERVAAHRAWLEGTLLVTPGRAAPPRLVVPLDELTERSLAEAVRRWLLRDVRLTA
ncbi:hypothetical protein NPS01_39380 [Nocardioides psychrotolerans]|uniref:Uncharacterized protein n=1 Tax=Nocardioides psychrotolerans TaxID=1005945 RepID=A0A1I3QVD4_9ACTN|nr:hypothetical protein [Nocardioides psychrotolerans]GEP40275.1 hypothetical protein NPS01_39380 [Nocardioides psychrotolerans]SFJ38233.1 hypothetical protein SAMN05216561_12817 [Nocardioides psychrotolerans]